MAELRKRLVSSILPRVQNPAQYIGGELNSIVKDHTGRLKFALAFPDTYTIGMSHLGIRILYHILNSRDDIVCERVFCPESDMEERLREEGVPLYSLESLTPLMNFDIVGFSLQYELCYTNVLTILDLAGIPLRAADRNDSHPLVIAGGPCCTNPEPMADFFDAFLLGDGEDAIVQISDMWRDMKVEKGFTKHLALIEMASSISGFYVPSLYDVRYADDGRIAAITPSEGVPPIVRSAIVNDLEAAPFPTEPIVPVISVIHDRITIEIMRGCLNGCRFCQAGMISRPQRYRSVAKVIEIAKKSYEATGYDTISLLSLSTSDHPQIFEMMDALSSEFKELNVGVALPSLRVGKAMFKLPAKMGEVRRSGLTLAPEVATDKQRGVISKMISEDELVEGSREAFKRGWKLVKLYFMFGLPMETQEDRAAITMLANRISMLGREFGKQMANVNVTVSTFIPKPHTPFQWARQITEEEEKAFRRVILDQQPYRPVKLKFGRPIFSLLEGMFSRGDRRLAATVHEAWKNGARLDAWADKLNTDAWAAAMEKTGASFEFYCNRERPENEVLPWSHLSFGIRPEFLLTEKHRAENAEPTEICGKGICNGCMTDIKCPNRVG